MTRCHKHGRRICIWCGVQTLAFPVEHFIWERLPGLSLITHAMGL